MLARKFIATGGYWHVCKWLDILGFPGAGNGLGRTPLIREKPVVIYSAKDSPLVGEIPQAHASPRDSTNSHRHIYMDLHCLNLGLNRGPSDDLTGRGIINDTYFVAQAA